MRPRVVYRIVGRFCLVFAGIIASPLLVGYYYGEGFLTLWPFLYAALCSLSIGLILRYAGNDEKPSVKEGVIATVSGWSLAIVIGGVPLMSQTGFMNAVFESAAGLTTTGISIFLSPEQLPHSILFWRGLMQWVGGLGILTFFIAVIRESGGISRRLFSAETHKSDPGSIRPSLKKSIIDLWRVYGFITFLIMGVFIGLGMPVFESIVHAFSTISTGGFSTQGGSIGFYSTAIQAATIPFMFLGGVNFVILYRVLRGELKAVKNSELKLYTEIFLLLSGFMFYDLMSSGALLENVLNAFFQSAAVLSSTGYATVSLGVFSAALQIVLIGVMFFGGSVGSTSGGLKTFRLKALIELMKTRLRSYSIPKTAINEVKIDGEIIDDSAIRTISVLLFVWIAVSFLGAVTVMVFDPVSFEGAFSGAVSSAGNMGPVLMNGEAIIELSWMSKLTWVVLMLAGRLEMLPVLAIFNRSIFPDSN